MKSRSVVTTDGAEFVGYSSLVGYSVGNFCSLFSHTFVIVYNLNIQFFCQILDD